MRLQRVPALQGLQWVRRGVSVFRQRPLAFAVLLASVMVAVLVLSLLPLIGSLVVPALVPLLALAFMIATRNVLEDGVPTPLALFVPLRAPRSRLVSLGWLGAIYAAAVLVGLELCDLLDGGRFEAMMEAMPRSQVAPETMAAHLMAPGLLSGMLIRFGLLFVLALPFWHAAPALVYWEGHGCAQALFVSVLACWRNLAALAVCSVAWVALLFMTAMAGAFVFTLIGAPQLFVLAAIPIWMLFVTLFHTTLYFPYIDCFAAGDVTPTTDDAAARDRESDHVA